MPDSISDIVKSSSLTIEPLPGVVGPPATAAASAGTTSTASSVFGRIDFNSSNSNSSAGWGGSADLITGASIICSGAALEIEIQFAAVLSNGNEISISAYMDGASLGTVVGGFAYNLGGTQPSYPGGSWKFPYTPPAGAHTFKFVIFSSAGGSAHIIYAPIYLRVYEAAA